MYNFVNPFPKIQQFRRGLLTGFTPDEDPTFLTFSVDFIFEPMTIPSLGLYNSPLFITDIPDVSAYHYLMSKGFRPEAERIKKFGTLLKTISTKMPWYFQSIKGLDKMWSNATGATPQHGAPPLNNRKGKDVVLEFETLESLDLKISYLGDLYKSGAFDSMYMRDLLPQNLRRFQVDVYVSEFRNLATLTQDVVLNRIVKNELVNNFASRALDLLKAGGDAFHKNVTFYKFSCYMCEFDFSKTFPSGEFKVYDINTPATNKFSIHVGNFLEQHQFAFHEILTKEFYSMHVGETESTWKKARRLTLDGMVGAVGGLVNAWDEVKDTFEDANDAFSNIRS